MDQKNFNKVIFVLVILAIAISLFSTLIIMNYVSVDEGAGEFDKVSSSSGSISLNIAKEPQEYSSTASINLDIVSPEVN